MVKSNRAYEYSCKIVEQGGKTHVYTFNQLNQNAKIEEILGDNVLNSTYITYLHSDINSNLLTKVRYAENGMERIENYTYTDKWDISSYLITYKNNTQLSNIKYEYDYESDESEYYGICTKTTTKMNNDTNIVETTLTTDYPYCKKAVGSTTVTRNGVKEKE